MHMQKCHLRCQTVNTNTRTLQQNSLHSFRCPCVFCFFSQPIFFDKPMDTKNQSPKTFSDFDVIVVPLLYLFNGSAKHDHPIEIRLMAEILHHFWVDGISLHPLNLNIGGIQMQETDAVMNGWNPAPPSMSSQHWNYGGCRGKHQRCYNAIHGRRCRISAINSTQTDL